MNVAELLDISAQVMPAAPAARLDGASASFADLADRARSLRLGGLTIGPGSIVALVQETTPDFLATMFGLLARGATVAPLNVRAKAHELARLLAETGADAVVHDERYRGVVQEALEGLGGVATVETSALEWSPVPGEGLPSHEPAKDDIALVLFTSGTTGLPKRVPFSHTTIVEAVVAAAAGPTGATAGTTVVSVPNHHIAGISTILTSVFSGRTMELLPEFSGARWLRLVTRSGADHAFVVPTMLRLILDEPDFDGAPLSGLRTLAYGAAPMPKPLIVEALRRLPESTMFVGSYGQTETAGTICVLTADDHRRARDGEPEAALRLGSIGRPVQGVEIRALAESADAVLPPGEVGELAARPAGAAWRRTGDRGHVDAEGYVFLAGRKDDTIIRGGENIDPVEVENALLTHADVVDVAVAGMPDATWGEIVVAFVVAREGRVDSDELATHVKKTLASYKAPSRVVPVVEIARTATGKTLRRELVATHLAIPDKEEMR